jgi:CheY-like chemotaxis protein/mannose-6-phosphate isomerase-like protein (cupin superfamily)
MAFVEHPWGLEEIWARTPLYVGRALHLPAGASTGRLCHDRRDKTLRVQRGVVSVHLDAEAAPRELSEGDALHVPAGVGHVIVALDEAELTEISTPDGASDEPPPGDPLELDPEFIIDDPEIVDPVTREPPRAAVVQPGGKVVVVVEDDLLIQDILVRALGARHTVYRADDGAQGLALIEALPSVDVVITDLMMPWMNGLELVQALKASPAHSKIPVIVLSARAASGDVALAINAGARSYVSKPFKLRELLAQVEKITSGH